MGILFLSYLLGGIFQFSSLSLFWRKTASLSIFVFQFFIFYSLWNGPALEVLAVGNWPHFAGIIWMKDPMSLFFVAAPLILFPPAYFGFLKNHPENRLSAALLFFFAAALVGAFFTADLFNLFVMFEILLLSSYTFFARAEKLSAGKLFIWSNIIGSALFLIAVAYVYKVLGTVNMADISIRAGALPTEIKNFLFWVMGFVFLFKAGIWPLYLWMPSSYPSLSPSLLAFFGVLSSKVGLYAFVRWTTLMGWSPLTDVLTEFQILCAATLFLATAAAFSARSFRASLAYWSFGHMGLSLLALTLSQPLGLAGLLIYFLQDVIVAAGLFFFCEAHEKASSPRQLFVHSPKKAIVFIFLALSASGFPLTSGFWPKWVFLRASVDQALALGLILFSALMFLGLSISLWNRYFVGPSHSDTQTHNFKLPWQVYYCAGISVFLIFFGLVGQNFLFQSANLSYRPDHIAQEVMQRSQEIENSREVAK